MSEQTSFTFLERIDSDEELIELKEIILTHSDQFKNLINLKFQLNAVKKTIKNTTFIIFVNS
jgi:hypothetical protein